jgi:hypothetical protein
VRQLGILHVCARGARGGWFGCFVDQVAAGSGGLEVLMLSDALSIGCHCWAKCCCRCGGIVFRRWFDEGWFFPPTGFLVLGSAGCRFGSFICEGTLLCRMLRLHPSI